MAKDKKRKNSSKDSSTIENKEKNKNTTLLNINPNSESKLSKSTSAKLSSINNSETVSEKTDTKNKGPEKANKPNSASIDSHQNTETDLSTKINSKVSLDQGTSKKSKKFIAPINFAQNNDSKEEAEQESTLFTSEPPPVCTFKQLGISEWLIDALKAVEIFEPTEIQRACIPKILKGESVIGGAKTGSGKTAAFALPILHNLSLDPYGVYALILTPTRELAIQIAEQFTVFGKSINLKTTVIVGGLDMMDQALSLTRRPHIVVATPGRLADHVNSCSDAVNFARIKYLVLDEADQLLTPTFAPDLEVIMDAIPKSKSTLLFTATMAPSVTQYYNMKKLSGNAPFVHIIKDEIKTVSELDQYYLLVPSYVKDSYLVQLLLKEEYAGKSTIIFTNRCKTAETISVMLQKLGFKSTSLHSKMGQQDRLNSLGRFRAMATKILVTTGVGSRGLDIPFVELVVNLDCPRDPNDYIHRVGRTARAGRSGEAITIATENDVNLVLAIEEKVGKKLVELVVEEKEVLERLNKVMAARRVAAMHLIDNSFGEKDYIRKKKAKKNSKRKNLN
ncbi:ATP-dependent RNA helicase dbp8 [Smittium culicis]|uniref:ATP-dependent RNA helicase dbp8 n=1 Tax=Smittium culicis TaxID=133412 RepID=A0A1R1YHU9_9FUNG|nr:ATP-dependent RNA helicase dbp8 [Smittium culicis]